MKRRGHATNEQRHRRKARVFDRTADGEMIKTSPSTIFNASERVFLNLPRIQRGTKVFKRVDLVARVPALADGFGESVVKLGNAAIDHFAARRVV